MGPWSVTEGVALMENVCKATGVKAMRGSMKLVVMKESQVSSMGTRYAVDEERGEQRVRDIGQVQLKEVLPHLIKPKRAYNNFIEKRDEVKISWSALQENMKTRSVDDIRNYWTLKIEPLLKTYGGADSKRRNSDNFRGKISYLIQWTEAEDISLL